MMRRYAFHFVALVTMCTAEVHAAAGARTKEALARVRPAYDPTAKDRVEPSQAESADAATADRAESVVSAGAPPAASGVITLAPVIVERMRPPEKKPPAPIPRVAVPPTFKNVQIDPFDTKEARKAKIVERRLSAFDRFFLNRFKLPLIGQSLESRAMALEAEAVRASNLNNLAQMIDILHATEGDTEEVRELRKLHRELYTAGRR